MTEKNERLSNALEFLDLTHQQAYKRLNYKNSQKVTDLCNGKQKITPEIAEEFENEFNISKVWIIFGLGSMFSNENQDLKRIQEENKKRMLENKVQELEDEFLKKLDDLKKLIS